MAVGVCICVSTQRRSDMVELKMAEVTLIDFSYLNSLALSTFTEDGALSRPPYI